MNVELMPPHVVAQYIACQPVNGQVILHASPEFNVKDYAMQMLGEYAPDFYVEPATAVYTKQDKLMSALILRRHSITIPPTSSQGVGVHSLLCSCIETGADMIIYNGFKSIPSNIRNAMSRVGQEYTIKRIDTDIVRFWMKDGSVRVGIYLCPEYIEQ